MRKPACQCAQEFRVIYTTDYQRVKKILNDGNHPSFIGRRMVHCHAVNGGCMIFQHQGQDIAAAVVNARLNVLLVLNVEPQHRSHGLGTAALEYLQCNFARVLESAVPFFERTGYQAIGELKQGNKLRTQIMVKQSLIPLAGRIARIFSAR